jgi:hypothetical protein
MAFSTLGGQIATAKHITFGQEMILALDHITHVDAVWMEHVSMIVSSVTVTVIFLLNSQILE